VIAVGAGVTEFVVGDEVYARPRDLRIGTFAERIAIDEADVAHKPTSLTMEQAAAVPPSLPDVPSRASRDVRSSSTAGTPRPIGPRRSDDGRRH